jgi:ribosomal protein S18 acetylase RimI-like enzyme
MDVARRMATTDDEALARRMHHAAYRDVVERQFGYWDEAEQDSHFARAWNEHDHDILQCADTPCGYAAIELCRHAIVVHELVLHPDFQGQGIGTQVLLETIRRAQSLDVPVRLKVLHANDRATRLYERLGFRERGTTASHRQMWLPS